MYVFKAIDGTTCMGAAADELSQTVPDPSNRLTAKPPKKAVVKQTGITAKNAKLLQIEKAGVMYFRWSMMVTMTRTSCRNMSGT